MKRCKFCREKFQPARSTQSVCSVACSIALQQKNRLVMSERLAIEERKADRIKLEGLRPLSYFAEKAQKAVNALVRYRDRNEPCISCGRFHDGKWNAGHYISRARSQALRYDLDNIHKQCEPCNTSLSGNLLEYRKNLIRKIGVDRVESLEVERPLPRFRKDDYLRIESEAKAQLREMKCKEQN